MGVIDRITGPVIVAKGVRGMRMNEVVDVGNEKIMGEVIALKEDTATIQVYEDTSGVRPGEPVEGTGSALRVELGPGLLSSVYDGIQRPLEVIEKKAGVFIKRGVKANSLDRSKKWKFSPSFKKGQEVSPGDVLGTVKEFGFEHRVLVPPSVSGKLSEIKSGEHTVDEVIAVVEKHGKKTELRMMQEWEVRKQRPFSEKMPVEPPLISGMRVLDALFPVAKGGTAAIPGPFGSGKTVTLSSWAKYCDADIIVYIGCGERGNEMTEVLNEFPKLVDPRTKKPLMERTVLIANTSNMPVAAREASIYTGITIAEYYRDMGYDVALMADSTSRWAEAMREISGRLEEMPGEEGYPVYLGRRLAEFYERAGRVKCIGDGNRGGSVTVLGAVSPPGGDLSEPVSQSTLRVTQVFWALDASLSRRRHFPAINWLKSYSLYAEVLQPWLAKNVAQDFNLMRKESLEILQKEAELQAVVQLIGPDALPDKERLLLEIARMLREDFLQQNAYDEVDAYSTLRKQYLMLKVILHYYRRAREALSGEIPLEKILQAPEKQCIAQLKRVKEEEIEKTVKEIEHGIDKAFG
jgi:V/A-type H+-transporting ATPase subunit A